MLNEALVTQTRYGQLVTLNERPSFPCSWLNQVHGDNFVKATECDTINEPLKADGILSHSSDIMGAYAIKTADCMAVLIEGDHGWAIVHLGWRGLQLKMIQKSEVLQLNPTHVWIAPHICRDCYEVQGAGHPQDFTKNFPLSDNFHQVQDKLYFSLQDELIEQIKIIAPECEIMPAKHCTFTQPWLHSYRRNGTKKRNWTIFLDKTTKL